ncbi:MAG: hypothetical protein KKD94_06350 [Nanoarchaeota archaeon]|nr:hypothetical protein [Nanoarchaeota archaeon]
MGLGFDPPDGAFMEIRNAQEYPVSIEIGTKIAQVLWLQHKIVYSTDCSDPKEFMKPIFNNPLLCIGEIIDSDLNLQALIDLGELQISPECYYTSTGQILLHAGKTETKNKQKHVILYKDGRTEGIDITSIESENHIIKPGEFVDIQTLESIKLSDKIGMLVKYDVFNPFDDELFQVTTSEDYWLTKISGGGWIDPGYEGGFSVQRKSFLEEVIIKEGEPVAIGIIFSFPDGVSKKYGHHRGSHYQGNNSFAATQQ